MNYTQNALQYFTVKMDVSTMNIDDRNLRQFIAPLFVRVVDPCNK